MELPEEPLAVGLDGGYGLGDVLLRDWEEVSDWLADSIPELVCLPGVGGLLVFPGFEHAVFV